MHYNCSAMARQSETQITFRLPRALAARLDRLARASARKRSELLRDAAEAYVDVATSAGRNPASDRVRALFGSVRTGIPDLAERHSEYMKRVLARGR